MGFWIDRGDIYSYSDIWILTLKRIYAEGLQQRRRKKEVGLWSESTQMNPRFKIILTLLVLAAMFVIFLVIPIFVLKR